MMAEGHRRQKISKRRMDISEITEKMEEEIRINNRTAVSKNSIWVRKRLSVTCIKNGNRKDTA